MVNSLVRWHTGFTPSLHAFNSLFLAFLTKIIFSCQKPVWTIFTCYKVYYYYCFSLKRERSLVCRTQDKFRSRPFGPAQGRQVTCTWKDGDTRLMLPNLLYAFREKLLFLEIYKYIHQCIQSTLDA